MIQPKYKELSDAKEKKKEKRNEKSNETEDSNAPKREKQNHGKVTQQKDETQVKAFLRPIEIPINDIKTKSANNWKEVREFRQEHIDFMFSQAPEEGKATSEMRTKYAFWLKQFMYKKHTIETMTHATRKYAKFLGECYDDIRGISKTQFLKMCPQVTHVDITYDTIWMPVQVPIYNGKHVSYTTDTIKRLQKSDNAQDVELLKQITDKNRVYDPKLIGMQGIEPEMQRILMTRTVNGVTMVRGNYSVPVGEHADQFADELVFNPATTQFETIQGKGKIDPKLLTEVSKHIKVTPSSSARALSHFHHPGRHRSPHANSRFATDVMQAISWNELLKKIVDTIGFITEYTVIDVGGKRGMMTMVCDMLRARIEQTQAAQGNGKLYVRYILARPQLTHQDAAFWDSEYNRFERWATMEHVPNEEHIQEFFNVLRNGAIFDKLMIDSTYEEVLKGERDRRRHHMGIVTGKH